VLFRMSLAPPRNHVAQCPKKRSTFLIIESDERAECHLAKQLDFYETQFGAYCNIKSE
jgi:hypothetical protein